MKRIPLLLPAEALVECAIQLIALKVLREALSLRIEINSTTLTQVKGAGCNR
jgi:hypothetical protein